jgi:GNAT superfamily N-acetyltransferase
VTVRIGTVPAELTWPLRQAVLRPHQAPSDLALPDDGYALTVSLAATDLKGEVVGTARVATETPSGALGERLSGAQSWRLRGMAVREDRRNEGVGAALLHAVIAHVAAHSGGNLWCAARLPSLPFYRREGFVEFGTPWEEPHIGPHVHMWRTIDAGADADV